MIKQIDFVSVPVADQKRALDFYTRVLGLQVFTDQAFGEDQRWIELKIGASPTKLVLFTSEADKARIGSFMNFTLNCSDLEETCRTLRDRGVEFVQPPKREPWGHSSIFKDSEGNQILLGEK